MTSYHFNRQPAHEARFYRLGWDGNQSKYDFLRSLGWTEIVEPQKVRWLHTMTSLGGRREEIDVLACDGRLDFFNERRAKKLTA
jgi:hypothetical protein